MKALIAASAAVLACAVMPAVAGAATCADRPTTKAFQPWGDHADYFLAPGGSFEGTNSWWLSGGAGITSGNEPWYIAGQGVRSLKIPAAGRATSPWFCATWEHPQFRFFARPLTGSGSLSASVRLVASDGTILERTVGTLYASATRWVVSPPMDLVSPYHPAVALLDTVDAPQQPTASVVFRATGGTWAVDDVFVDPYRTR